MRKPWRILVVFAAGALLSLSATAQESAPQPIALTLKRAIELALQNSKDIQVAKIQASIADHAALINKAQFLPNVYAGSGAGYTYGIPETPGGRAPALFNVTYTEQVFNEPLRGQGKEQQEQARAQKIVLEDARNSVIVRTASAYLELVKVRHSAELLQKEQDSAEKILGVIQQRAGEGFELPVEVTRAQLTKAQVAQRLLQLQGREDELEMFLRSQCGLSPEQEIEVTPEDLPGAAEQEGANLIASAMRNNTDLRLAQSEVQAKEFRLTGEKRGYWPTLELVSVYSLLANFNNYSLYFNHFQRNNYNLGIQAQVPLFQPQHQSQRSAGADQSAGVESFSVQQTKPGERGSAPQDAAGARNRRGERSGAAGTATGAAEFVATAGTI